MISSRDILQFIASRRVQLFTDYRLVKIGLFGSFACNEETPESDIDLLIEFEPHTADLTEKKANLKSEFEQEFERNVDLCREKYIKPYYKRQILESTIYV